MFSTKVFYNFPTKKNRITVAGFTNQTHDLHNYYYNNGISFSFNLSRRTFRFIQPYYLIQLFCAIR